jgi:hypothetical protein
VEEP